MKTEQTTQTLADFLADHAICRVWMAGQGCPAGRELVLDLEDDGEDYCDSENLLDFLPHGSQELGGSVTKDADGERRWEPTDLSDVDLRDGRQNSIYKLVVWAE